MKRLFLLLLFPLFLSALSFEPLPSNYTFSYGKEKAPLHIVEYFSLSCPHCLKLFNQEFPLIKEKYIDCGKVHWTFHPDPGDLVTLQAMICLSKLSSKARQHFMEHLMQKMNVMAPGKSCFVMQQLMEELGAPLPLLHDLSFVEKDPAFEAAYTYFSQKEIPNKLPSVTIGGVLYRELPSLKLLDRIFHRREE